MERATIARSSDTASANVRAAVLGAAGVHASSLRNAAAQKSCTPTVAAAIAVPVSVVFHTTRAPSAHAAVRTPAFRARESGVFGLLVEGGVRPVGACAPQSPPTYELGHDTLMAF
eukprot:IDg9892t1